MRKILISFLSVYSLQGKAEGGGHLPFLHQHTDDERECGSWRPGLEARAAKKIRPRLLRGPRGQINETVWVKVWFTNREMLGRLRTLGLELYSAARVYEVRARISKRSRSPGIDSKESIPPAYVAWRASPSNRVVVPAWESIPELLKRLTNSGSVRGVSVRFKQEEIR